MNRGVAQLVARTAGAVVAGSSPVTPTKIKGLGFTCRPFITVEMTKTLVHRDFAKGKTIIARVVGTKPRAAACSEHDFAEAKPLSL